jgi:RNA polymerase sigma-70 factor (ECF subfamily)
MFLIPADTPIDRRESFEKEVLPHFDAVRRVALRLVRDSSSAQDLVQDTFMRALRGFHGYTAGTNAKAWLFTVLYSVFNSRYRRQQRAHNELSLDELESRYTHAVEHEPDWSWSESEAARALSRLPEPFRSAVLLVDVEELSYEEAALALGCAVGTVRSRLFRGRKALAVELVDLARRRGYLGKERSES